jgi:hypothetical protein
MIGYMQTLMHASDAPVEAFTPLNFDITALQFSHVQVWCQVAQAEMFLICCTRKKNPAGGAGSKSPHLQGVGAHSIDT